MKRPFLSPQVPIADQNGYATPPHFGFLQDIVRAMTGAAGNNVFEMAGQPTLGPQDAGYVGLVSDYGHLVRWTGTVWEFVPGDACNGFLQPFAVAPTQSYWGLCDGSVYSYLVMGATLTTANFTTPNLTGTAAYLRSGAYTGTITAAGGATGVNLSYLAIPYYFRR